MDLYSDTSYALSKSLTLKYSTSFSQSSRLFDKSIQKHIFAIYGLVRIADETVDTYTGGNRASLLTSLEKETYAAIESGYSTNPIVHAFALTAHHFAIGRDLIEPFFESMRMDLRPLTFSPVTYEKYIYGSAEVIGLMCLKVFCAGDQRRYEKRVAEARALGAAYQKVNFLRDFAGDYHERQRVYFPGVAFDTFNEADKSAIIADIQKDFKKAKPALATLPLVARKAVSLSYAYYTELLNELIKTPAEVIKVKRIRVSDIKKAALLVRAKLPERGAHG